MQVRNSNCEDLWAQPREEARRRVRSSGETSKTLGTGNEIWREHVVGVNLGGGKQAGAESGSEWAGTRSTLALNGLGRHHRWGASKKGLQRSTTRMI